MTETSEFPIDVFPIHMYFDIWIDIVHDFKLISCLGTCQMRPFIKGVYFHTTILSMWCQEWLCVQKEVLEKYVTLGSKMYLPELS